MNVLVVFLIVPIISNGKVIQLEDSSAKIISGQPAKEGQFPWQALLIISRLTHIKVCGGSLITTRWVLTAAHCVIGLRKVVVRLGTLKSRFPFEKESLVITTDRAILHKNFNTNVNDIALVDLKEDVKLSDYVKTIPLGTKTIGSGVSVTVSGWGMTYDNSRLSEVLRYTNLTTITHNECRRYYDTEVPDTALCCSGALNRSICRGDSGGPLVEYNKKGNAILVGIVSFGSKFSCTKGRPSGFTRIKSFYEWILSYINK